MDRVEEEPEEHVAERGFPGNFPAHEKPGFAVPPAASSSFVTCVSSSAAFFSYAAIDSGTVGAGSGDAPSGTPNRPLAHAR